MVAGGGMLMPIIFYEKKYGAGYNAARGFVSRDIAVLSYDDMM